MKSGKMIKDREESVKIAEIGKDRGRWAKTGKMVKDPRKMVKGRGQWGKVTKIRKDRGKSARIGENGKQHSA